MEEKVLNEYKKYSERILTPVEIDYLKDLKRLEKLALRNGKQDE